MAAVQGDALAQLNLGILCFNGRGVPQDYTEAAKWHHKAADQGNAQAQLNLGVMYARGQGVPPDYVESLKWLILAASGSSPEELKEIAKHRDAVVLKMTRDEMAEAHCCAREWKPEVLIQPGHATVPHEQLRPPVTYSKKFQ